MLESPNYSIISACIVASGGSTHSASYSLDDVSIGRPFGGTSQSANYSLDVRSPFAKLLELTESPNPPVINPIINPTNVPTHTLTGSKDLDTSIYINGYEKVTCDSQDQWSCNYTFQEGTNELIATSRKSDDTESDPVYKSITLDTIPPSVVINNPLAKTFVYQNPLNIEGTKDGASFSKEENISFGVNRLIVEASDEAGNTVEEKVEVYLVHEPLSPPQTQ